MMNVIVVENVSKQFKKPLEPFWQRGKNTSPTAAEAENGSNEVITANSRRCVIAVNDVSFNVVKGEIFGVLGPNGGGKSTLIRLLSTLMIPDKGKIVVMGFDIVKQPMQVQQLINRVSVEASFFKKLSPLENLMYGARLYGMESRQTRKQISEILTRLGLEKSTITSPMEEMSRGMQQKVAIARALLSKPKLLLLDEPTTGLDPRSKREVQAVVREMRDRDGTTILLTTHDMAEAEALCDRIAIMSTGKVIALDTPAGLKKLVKWKNDVEPSLEDVFIELTGKNLVNRDEEEEAEEE